MMNNPSNSNRVAKRFVKADPANYSIKAYLLKPFREMASLMGMSKK